MGKHGKPAGRIPGWVPPSPKSVKNDLEPHFEPEYVAQKLSVHRNTVLRNLTAWFPRAIKLQGNLVRIPESDFKNFLQQTRIKQEAT
jgi:predicted DNA-binding transcriptional regulator AlpA